MSNVKISGKNRERRTKQKKLKKQNFIELSHFDQTRHQIRGTVISILSSKNIPLNFLTPPCPKCGSKDVKEKEQVNRKKKGTVKVFKCRECERKYSEDYLIRSDLDLRNVAKLVELAAKHRSPKMVAEEMIKSGVKISTPSVYSILYKVAEVLLEFEEIVVKFTPSYLLIDDSPEKVSGKKVWITNVMDAKTRYWLASVVTEGRDVNASVEAIRRAVALLDGEPEYIKCDGYRGHIKAIEEFGLKYVSVPKTEDYSIVNEIEALHSRMRAYLPKRGAFRTIKSLNTYVQILRFKFNFFDSSAPARKAGIPFDLDLGWEWLLKLAIATVANYLGAKRRAERDR